MRPGDEVVEHIPWDRLTVNEPAHHSPLRYLALAVVVVLAGYAIWRFQGPDTGTTGITLAPAQGPALEAPMADTDAGLAAPGAPGDGAAPTPTAVTPSAQLTSEADLMAFVPIDGSDGARLRAEWFVLDFFSTSDVARTEKVMAAVGDQPRVAIQGESAPASGAGPQHEAVAYVDWVHAYDVEPAGDGHFDVRVAYRSLVTAAEGPYVTGPLRAVIVPIRVRGDGASVVTGLPTPIALPETLSHDDGAWAGADPPESVVAVALERLDGLVEQPSVASASTDGAAWRVVVIATGEGGIRLPYEVVVEPLAASAPQTGATTDP